MSQTDAKPTRDHSLFEAELSGAVLNLNLFVRLMGWLKPYSLSLIVSTVLVLLASFCAVLMEIVISRVLVDYIIVGETGSPMPDLGMIERRSGLLAIGRHEVGE